MRNVYGNLAYDLDRVKTPVQKTEVLVKPKPRKKLNLALVRACNIFLGVVIAASAAAMVYTQTSLAVISKEESKLSSTLEELKSESVSLNARVDNMFNLGYVENYAKENLSMMNVDESQIEYVYIQNEDEIVVDNGLNIFALLNTTFNNFMEYIK